MPAVSATVLTAYSLGRVGVQQLFSRLKIWRVGGKWWLVGIVVYPVLLVVAGLIYNLYNFYVPQLAICILPVEIGSLIANIIFLSIAAIGEEIGSRGVALPAP
jgi:membrane protease YdiL (CAAX protease family)